MRHFKRVFAIGHTAIVILFGVCAFALIGYGALELWRSLDPWATMALTKRFDGILECIAMLTVAMASLELADTLIEEEFNREARMNHSARVTRVLSRFMVVVVISLAIEALVATFHFMHDDPSQLLNAASIGFAAAALLIAWAVFVRFSKSSE